MAPSLARILELHPAPWKVDYRPREPHWPEHIQRQLCEVTDATGKELIWQETFTGDGARVNMEDEAIECLVEFINQQARITQK
jgi:hypothetical protein